MSQDEPVWRPRAAELEQTHVYRFGRRYAGLVPESGGREDPLHRWSVEHPDAFWSAVAEYAGVRFGTPPATVLSQPGDMMTARWFEGASFNAARFLLRDPDDSLALIAEDESGRSRRLSRAELTTRVAELAAGLRRLGVGPGDRVAAMLPNGPEAVIALLASASMGAVFSSASPEFGVPALLDRFGQIEPSILFVCDGYRYAGKTFDCDAKARELADALPSLRATIRVRWLHPERSVTPGGMLDFDAVRVPGARPDYAELPFAHPLCILFSSGTTGRPKCIVHGAGGTILQHMKEHLLHVDLRPGNTLFYFTTCGWMMWNWLVSALGTHAAVVLYDGSPFHPNADVLPALGRRHRVTVFGTSPRYLTALEKNDGRTAQIGWPALRCVLSTGAPLAAEQYDFVSSAFGPDVRLSSISGGTDIVSCFVLGSPALPVYRGEIQCPGLGMAVDVYDERGHSLAGAPGELVCTKAFPSMPTGFWNDPDGRRYRSAYFGRFPGVWTHGDRAELTEHGGYVISGRSDTVLNPGGVRIGSSEIINPVLTLPEVTDAIAVGYRRQGGESIALFVVLAEGASLTQTLDERIREVVRSSASPRHVPTHIAAVPEVPRTLSGKPLELAVRAIVNGEEPGHVEGAANPEALEYFRDRL